ncbi:winged helix-turn-helix transcriptional regulator [archaeon]|jgi:DNA-binding MarR family transcriptional regulator|nr:winged helix-turn-helix transcriptional regulator [Candidatus Woesearchaeota archaeon]MBT4136047.1 winged helix-turn-helix transcriptional regulator [archaeon]MBT4241272.1 winged helix-turn-helix transcriptional regulator [archaeon]MBT4418094.1 winged helix-turn-helix transcriptional regulator [archaeon]
MEDDHIKLAFSRVKEDIYYLTDELAHLKDEIHEIKTLLRNMHEEISTQKMHNLAQNTDLDTFSDRQTDNSTIRQINETHSANTTHNTTVPQEIEGLKYPNLSSSIGNEGVSTDRQTDRQTDNSTHNSTKITQNSSKNIESNIQEATEILDSLDRLKKQIRLKFKKITNREMAVFSTIYQLEEQDPSNTTYKQIAKILHLSQSSIRDYVQRMINKGIPVKKEKINNKQVILSISQELRKIATLSTIIQLREL